jgi:hypothetical protein
MTTYRAIASTEVDADSPLTATLALAWTNNVLAIQEGDPTAPDLAWAAIQPALADMVHDELGSVCTALVSTGTGTTYSPGDTISGGSLTPGSVYDDSDLGIIVSGTGSLTGTWQALSYIPADTLGTGQGLGTWIRVA